MYLYLLYKKLLPSAGITINDDAELMLKVK